MVQHSESRGTSSLPRAGTKYRARHGHLHPGADVFQASRAFSERACGEPTAGSSDVIRSLLANRRCRRPIGKRADRGERQQHRFLSRADHAGDAAPGNHLRRSLRAYSNACPARVGIGRCAGRLPRRRRGARRNGRAQAILARQFPVRTVPWARESGLQALPADRTREKRHLAAVEQHRNRQRSAVRRFFARTVAARGRGFL